MAAIKPIEVAAEKWVRRAEVATSDYEFGIKNPKRPWRQAAEAGNENWKRGVQGAIAADRFVAGIRRVGDEKWSGMALAKTGRFAEGVRIARDEWQRGYSPYHSAYQALRLPDRRPRGDPANLQRVSAVNTLFRSIFERGGRT